MLAFRPLMLLSLVANLVLAGALIWHFASPPAATIHAPSLHPDTAADHPMYQSVTDPTPAMIETAQAQWAEKLKAALGPERYADYQAVQNAGSDKLGKLIARLELPLTTITTVNALRDDINARAQTVTNDAALSAAARNAALAALAQEAQQKLTASLGGDRGYRAYAEIKGDWLRALKPKGK